jgi:hypothetical protein
MADGDLAHVATQSLSQYLIARRSQAGIAVFDAGLQNLLGIIEAELTEPYLAETFCRFQDNPANPMEIENFRRHLADQLKRNPGLRRQVESTLGGHVAKRARGRRKLVVCAVAVVVLALVSGFLVGQAFQAGQSLAAPTTAHSPTEPATTSPATTTTARSSTTTTAQLSTSSSASLPAVPGDGSALEKGKPVHLTALPRPNDEWTFGHGEHDVQFTQHQNSLWYELVTCNSRKSGTQQFRLQNFSRLEVKAIGMDSTSDTNVTVRFEVFANDDAVNPIASQVVGPGEAKELTVDLPANVFALTLRVAFDQVISSPCRQATAVWGAPYVVAAGR